MNNVVAHVLHAQDKCSLEGVSDGDLPPGVRPAGFRPLGTCFNSSDCTIGFDCKMTDDKTICSCDPATGSDTCRALGSCVMQPCKACEVCVQAMQVFPDIVKDTTRAEVIADRFKTFCTGTGRSPLACEATAAAITSSVAGSVGRRVASLCVSLAECQVQATPPCQVAATPTGTAQALDMCTVEGVFGGKAVADISGKAPAGSCKATADCTSPGTFCSMASTTRVCSCLSSTGVVSCETLGRCEPTACQVCSNCITAMQGHVTDARSKTTADVATAFQATCTSQSNTELMCAASAMFISTSNTGNLGRRAGALCSMMGECVGSLYATGMHWLTPRTRRSGHMLTVPKILQLLLSSQLDRVACVF